MSESAQGPGWWLASDGRWYPPELWTGPPRPMAAGVPVNPAVPAVRSVPSHDAGTSGFAVASLICSCAGIVLLGVPSVVGVVLGFVARSRIRNSYEALRGDGLALAGIIVGFVVVGLVILGLVVDATHGRTGQ
jgi:hypothetical protein